MKIACLAIVALRYGGLLASTTLPCVLTSMTIESPLLAQTAPTRGEPQKDPLALVTAAEHALNGGLREQALILLWKARDGVHGSPDPNRAAARESLDTLLPKVDPFFEERTRIEREAARTLLGIARAYSRSKWVLAAAGIATEAVAFDPAAVEKDFPTESEGTDGSPARGPDANSNAPSRNPFKELGLHAVFGDWEVRDGTLHSPQLVNRSAYYLTQRELDDHRIRVNVDFGGHSSAFGVMIGARDADDYYLVSTFFTKGSAYVFMRLSLWRAGEWKELAQRELHAGIKGTSADLEVAIRGATVVARAEGRRILSHTVDEPVRGKFGFFVAINSENRSPLAIRDVRVHPNPAEAAPQSTPASVDDQLQMEIAEALFEAEALIGDKDPEPAAELLRRTRRVALQVDTPKLRLSLLSKIDRLLGSIDPLHKRRQKAFADAAESLKPLANRYANAGLHHAAACVTEWMLRLDPEGQAVLARAYQERIADKAK